MSTHDGGPAFPVADAVYPNGQVQSGSWGMSLRDWFAGQAMVALHSSEQRGGRWDSGSAKICAVNAYAMADAMLAARGAK